MMKGVSVYWALLGGLLSVVAQVVTFYFRFGRWNTDSAWTDYLFFFLAGALGGWFLIFFLNRQPSIARRWIVLASFLIGTPFALEAMLGGGLLSPLGTLLLPQIPWVLCVWFGEWIGKFVVRG